jgi:hypothetical protein
VPDKRVANPQAGKRLSVKEGDVFGSVTVLRELPGIPRFFAGKKAGYRRRMECLCVCGKIFPSNLEHLRTGHTMSCGCVSRSNLVASFTTHQMANTDEYRIWLKIKERAYDRSGKNPTYANIGMDQDWENDFMLFYRHIGDRPSKRHSVDRIDNRGGYYPGNVRWATPAQQARNTCRNVWMMHNGERRLACEVAVELGIDPSYLRHRVNRNGQRVP